MCAEAEALREVANEIRKDLSAEMATHLSIIMSEIGNLKGQVNAHNDARFAHNWDHHLLSQMGETRKDWDAWRAGIDRWRWFIMGGLAIVSMEVPLGVALVPLFHH